jgi:tetratricopeptide (TPR) repeat protein
VDLLSIHEGLAGFLADQAKLRRFYAWLGLSSHCHRFLAKNVPFAGQKSNEHFNELIVLATDIGAHGMLGPAYLDLGLLHKEKGRREQAREYLSKAIERDESLIGNGVHQNSGNSGIDLIDTPMIPRLEWFLSWSFLRRFRWHQTLFSVS